MYPSRDPHPFKRTLGVAFAIASVAAAVISLTFYLNEDLRRTTFALVTEEVEEDGTVVKKTEIERRQPTEQQVREIARNREERKREELEDKAKAVREALIEIEEAATKRLQDFQNETPTQRLARLAYDLEDRATRQRSTVTSSDRFFEGASSAYETTRASTTAIMLLAKANAEQIRSRGPENFTQQDAQFQLERTRTMAQQADGHSALLQGIYGEKSRDRQREFFSLLGAAQTIGRISDEYLQLLQSLAAGEAISSEEAPSTAEDSSAPSEEELAAMSTGELYQTIQEMSAEVDEAFLEARAAELANLQNIPFEDARERVYAPKTDRGPDLSDALSQPVPSDVVAYEELTQALKQATQAAERMALAASSRRDQLLGQHSGKAAGEVQAQMEARGAMMMAARNAGRERGNVQDMRGLMSKAYGSSVTGEFETMRETRTMMEKATLPDRVGLKFNTVVRNAVPSRKIVDSSDRKGWIFFDTWYVIGPWERPLGSSFEQTYPPETAIDLDATYPGKGGVELEWRFVQSENIRINPLDEKADAIYYAYTEVFSDRERDVVVAVASDDTAKLWVNDLVVWEDAGTSR